MPRFCALDSGASKTDILLYTDGDVKLFRVGFGLNRHNISVEELMSRVDKIVRFISGYNIEASIWGLAGLDTDDDIRYWKNLLDGLGLEYSLIHDVEMVLYAGNVKGEGIAIIAGTGSNLYARKGDISHKCGDWGYQFGDDFSAYSVGRDILNIALKIYDGRLLYGSRLIKRIIGEAGIEFSKLPSKIYDMGVDDVAALSVIACRYIDSGFIKRIFKRRVYELERALKTALKIVPDIRNVYISGGLFKCRYFYRLAVERIERVGLEIKEYIEYPVVGGVSYLLKHFYGYPDDEVALIVENLKKDLRHISKAL